jgi:hypothetical protein
MRWMEHIAYMRMMKNAYKILVGKLKGRNLSEDLGIDGRIILKSILGGQGMSMWIRLMLLRIRIDGKFLCTL